ncbi:MAG: hypothetical protein ACYC0V_00575 [Armatimonadota bacterium]
MSAIRDNPLTVRPDLKSMAEWMNEIIDSRRAEAIHKDIAGRIRFIIEQSDRESIHINGITFKDNISLTDGCTGCCEVIQNNQTVFSAGYDKYNHTIEQVHMYIPGPWEATLDELVDESQRLQNVRAEQLLYAKANAWHIRTGDSI